MGIYDFLERKRMENEGITGTASNVNHRTAASPSKPEPTPAASAPATPATTRSYEEQKEHNRQLKRAEKAVENAEARIEELEQQLADMEAKMATAEGAADVSLFTRHAELKRQIDEAVEAWEAASEQLEALKN